MQKIIPHLWFDHDAEAAVGFYTSIFKNSKTGSVSRYTKAGAEVSGMAEASVMTVEFQLEGLDFIALNGGPYFTFTPSISFFVSCETPEEVRAYWDRLVEGGTVLMELDTYPFSESFGWVQDKFGVSWQVNLGAHAQKITPFLLFAGEQHGKAEEAMNFYISLFADSNLGTLERYDKGEGELQGTIKRAAFLLGGQEFMATDGGKEHSFTFSEAFSLLVNCETQEEIDRLWEALSKGGEEVECGWLKDRYGVSWQISPAAVNKLLENTDDEGREKVMKALFQMKKIDIEALKRAYEE